MGFILVHPAFSLGPSPCCSVCALPCCPLCSVSPVPPTSPVPVTRSPFCPAHKACSPCRPVIHCAARTASPPLLRHIPMDLRCGNPSTSKTSAPLILCDPVLAVRWWPPPDTVMCPQQRAGSGHPLLFQHTSVCRMGGTSYMEHGGTKGPVCCHRVVLVPAK